MTLVRAPFGWEMEYKIVEVIGQKPIKVPIGKRPIRQYHDFIPCPWALDSTDQDWGICMTCGLDASDGMHQNMNMWDNY